VIEKMSEIHKQKVNPLATSQVIST